MEEETNVDKLKSVKDKLAQVYKDEASDDIYDNGLLSVLNGAVLSVEQAIQIFVGRSQ